MSNPRALLARCAPHVGSYASSTGGAEWMPADIAHAVGRIRHPAGRALVLYMWADHMDSWPTVRDELLIAVSKLAAEKDWRVQRPGTLSGLISLAVHEIRQPNHCRRCKGAGERGGKPCDRCGGEGHVPYSGRARAFVSGLSRRALREHESWYEQIAALTRDIERRAIRDMRKALA